MNKRVTKHTLFKPSRAESKSQTTDALSRAITEDEIARRERKTEKLRAARLAKEAEDREEGRSKAAKKKGGKGGVRLRKD